MTLKGGSPPSCAACKYRRRKCTAACPLAPYFPANKPKMFQNVHRLFGVSNVTKTLESLETRDQRDDAMKSIIYEAEMRDRIPVYGCPLIINQLSSQLQNAHEELRQVNLQISTFKEQSNQREPVNHNACYWPSPQQEFGCMSTSVDSQNVEGTGSLPCRFCLNEYDGMYEESFENLAGSMLGLDIRSDVISNHNLFSKHLEGETSIYDTQSYIEYKETCESSS